MTCVHDEIMTYAYDIHGHVVAWICLDCAMILTESDIAE